LENARGFQGIYDSLLYSYIQGERSLYSSGPAPTHKTLLTDRGTLFPEFFTSLIKARAEDVSHLGTGSRASAGCLLVQWQLFAGWHGGFSRCFRL